MSGSVVLAGHVRAGRMSRMSRFEAPDPNYVGRVTGSFARQQFMTLLQAELRVLGPGEVEVQVPFRPDLTQQHGLFHAGVTGSIADTAGGYAGYSLFPANSSVLTVEFKINLIAPAKGEALVAAASVVKPGRTLTVCEIRVYAVSGGQRTLCATALQTLICLLDRDDR
jgi:uncharacterized protein (TIGR00369 family)